MRRYRCMKTAHGMQTGRHAMACQMMNAFIMVCALSLSLSSNAQISCETTSTCLTPPRGPTRGTYQERPASCQWQGQRHRYRDTESMHRFQTKTILARAAPHGATSCTAVSCRLQGRSAWRHIATVKLTSCRPLRSRPWHHIMESGQCCRVIHEWHT